MKSKFNYLIVILLVLVLCGCSAIFNKPSNEPTTAPTNLIKETSNISGKLKVAYWNDEQFMRDYGNILQLKYPNVVFEVIKLPLLSQTNDYEITFKKMIEDNDIDLVFTRGFLQYLAKNNVLYELNPLIDRDHYDLSKIYPPVFERLLQMGGGTKLYGMSSTFLMKALYYNKDLFDEYAISYPTDNMTWNDVILLAKKFNLKAAAEKRIGLTIADPSPFQLLLGIAKSEGLSEFDSTGRFNISTKEWIAIWDYVAEQIRAQNIVIEGNRQIGSSSEQLVNNFPKGLSAMTISNSVLVRELFKAGVSFNWGLVTEPVNKNAPNESDSIYLSDVFAIHAKSKNVDLTWEMLKFLNSEEGTVLFQKQDNYVLTSHTPFVKEVRGHDVNAFYKLQLKKTKAESIPPSFYAQLDAPAADEFVAVVAGDKSTTDAVQALEAKGNHILSTISDKLLE